MSFFAFPKGALIGLLLFGPAYLAQAKLLPPALRNLP
jgi:hypothetical protein